MPPPAQEDSRPHSPLSSRQTSTPARASEYADSNPIAPPPTNNTRMEPPEHPCNAAADSLQGLSPASDAYEVTKVRASLRTRERGF
ncbi:hypothetical protein D9M71_583280 [compost metagenome]